MPPKELDDVTFISVQLKPGQWKLIDGIKIRNVSSRVKQLDLTITNLDADKRIGNRFSQSKKEKK